MNLRDRQEAYDRFNKKGSSVDVFLTSFNIAAYGLNLQYDCWHGVIIQLT